MVLAQRLTLCAKIRETPSCPEISLEGGEGHLHEEAVNWY